MAKNNRLRNLSEAALCTALLCVSAFIKIPLPFTPVPITAQTAIVCAAGLLLSPVWALASVAVYIALGAVGVPIFTGGAGIGYFVTPTGGYLLAFLAAAPIVSIIKGKSVTFFRYLVAALISMPVIYTGGTAMFVLIHGKTVAAALQAAVIPFIFADVLKCVLAAYIAFAVNRILQKRKQ